MKRLHFMEVSAQKCPDRSDKLFGFSRLSSGASYPCTKMGPVLYLNLRLNTSKNWSHRCEWVSPARAGLNYELKWDTSEDNSGYGIGWWGTVRRCSLVSLPYRAPTCRLFLRDPTPKGTQACLVCYFNLSTPPEVRDESVAILFNPMRRQRCLGARRTAQISN